MRFCPVCFAHFSFIFKNIKTYTHSNNHFIDIDKQCDTIRLFNRSPFIWRAEKWKSQFRWNELWRPETVCKRIETFYLHSTRAFRWFCWRLSMFVRTGIKASAMVPVFGTLRIILHQTKIYHEKTILKIHACLVYTAQLSSHLLIFNSPITARLALRCTALKRMYKS